MQCRAILFDLDGVLVDSRECIELIWHAWAAERGLDPADFLRVAHGRRIAETLRLVAPQLDASVEAAVLDAMEEVETRGLRATPGAAALLRQLSEAQRAIVTSGSRAVATLRLRTAGLPIPDVFVTAGDVKQGKPYVLAPGRPERAVQLVDVRDLAEWCVRLAEQYRIGVFNAVGPRSTLMMGRLLEDCAAVTESFARFIWIPDEDLLAAEVKPWTELPLWIPESDSRMGGMLLADNRRAVAAGLTFRPLGDTIRVTLDWDRQEGAVRNNLPIRVTPIAPWREAELIAHCA